MANEIASAYIALTTKMPGVKKDIESALADVDSEGAGNDIGEGVGRGISGKQAAIAGAFGGIFASITNMAAGAIGDLFADAVTQSDSVDKFVQTMSFAGIDTSWIDAAKKATKDYADSTVYDLSTIQNTTAQLAANGITNYSELTQAAGNLNAVAGGNSDTFSSVAMMLSQTAGQGKLTTENWNQLSDAIPGAAGRLQQALADSGAYTGNFRDEMAKGEITADEFNTALLELGTQPVAVEAASSVSTMEGAVGNLSAAITGALADAFSTIKPYLTEFIAGLADSVTWVQDNINWIGPLAAGIAIAAAAWGAYATVMGIVAAYQTAAAAAEGGLTVAQWLLNAAMSANPIGLIIVGIGLLIGAIILLVQNWDTVVAWITDIWGGFVGWLTDGLNGFVAWWNDVWAGFGGWISDVWNGIVSAVQAVWIGFTVWLIQSVAGFLDWWNGIWDTVGSVFRTVWEGLGSFVGGIWSGIVDGIRWYVNMIIGLINGIIDGVNVLIGGAGAVIGIDMQIPRIPELAAGGVVTASAGGTLARIGEGGRDEAVIPLPDGWRENGIGGSPVTVEQHFAHLDPREASRIAANDLAFALRGA